MANLLSNLGTWMQLVAQSLLVLQLTHSSALTGLTVSLQAAPGLLLGLLGGSVVDRLPRNVVVMASQTGLGLIAALTGVLAFSHLLTVPLVIALGVASGVIAAVDGPAMALFGNELVAETDVASAIAIGSVVSNAGRVVGTAVAGAAIALGGVGAAYLFNAMSFIVVAAVVPFVQPVRPVAPAGKAQRHGVRAGLSWISRSPELLALIGIAAITSVLGRTYSLTFAALVTGPLHEGPQAYGLVASALAIGAVIGAIVAGRVQNGAIALVVFAAFAGSCLQAVAAFSPAVSLLVIVALPLALSESIQDTVTGALLQTRPPAHMRGRVLGAWQTSSSLWRLAGPLVMGSLMQSTGVRTGLVLGAVLSMVVIGALAIRLSMVAIRCTSQQHGLPRARTPKVAGVRLPAQVFLRPLPCCDSGR